MTGVTPRSPSRRKQSAICARDAEVTQLHQQVVAAAHRVQVRLGKHPLQIVVGKVQVAAQAQSRRVAYHFLQSVNAAREVLVIVLKSIIGVWRGDQMGGAVGGRHPAHLYRDFPGLRAVVYLGQDVAVDIDHALPLPWNRLCWI